MEKIPHYLTIEELASSLQVPKSWIYTRTREKRIPHYKFGKYVRFSKSEISDWIGEQGIKLKPGNYRNL